MTSEAPRANEQSPPSPASALNHRLKKLSRKAGLSPGTLVHIGERKAGHVGLDFICYGPDAIEERELAPADIPGLEQPPDRLSWLNVEGLHDTGIIESLGRRFHLHPLALEDIVNTLQRPKLDDYGDHLFIVFKMLTFDPEEIEVSTEQVSLVLTRTGLISFQEGLEGDCFDPVRVRLREGRGRSRKSGPDYLAYALLDVVVDNYFRILEQFGEIIEELEEQLVEAPTQDTLHSIHWLKRTMLMMRRAIWPLRDVIMGLERLESPLVDASTRPFLRDVYDHVAHIIDTLEVYRDMLSGMLDIYLSSASHRMNGVMKVLTLIATVFMPLTFLAGIYGMNFQHMPELGWPWAYPALWGVMLVIAGFMVYMFRRKHWL